MNAYQILGIMSHIDNEMDEHSANEKIMNKVKTIVLSSIEQINQIINSSDISTEEKVKKIGDGVSATVRVIVSYMKIIDAEKRKAYNLTDKTNIDDELISEVEGYVGTVIHNNIVSGSIAPAFIVELEALISAKLGYLKRKNG